MIVYIATYPRSGNSLLQHMIRRNFRHLTSQIKAGVKSIPVALKMMRQQTQGFDLVHAAKPLPDWTEDVLWHERLAAYRFEGEPWRRVILPGPIETLTEEFRQALARESNFFFLKTHNLPFERYFEGEFAIQSVRHPGAVHWSYFRHQNDFIIPRRLGESLFDQKPPTLDNVILGETNFGSWSAYQNAWRKAGERLGPRFLSFAFETLTADQLATLERIAALLGLPMTGREVVSFEAFRQRFPGKDLRGASDGYEQYYSERQLDLLWSTHGATALTYAYAPPDKTLACPDEQVRRLAQLLATAWERHAELSRRPSARPTPQLRVVQDKRT